MDTFWVNLFTPGKWGCNFELVITYLLISWAFPINQKGSKLSWPLGGIANDTSQSIVILCPKCGGAPAAILPIEAYMGIVSMLRQ